MRMNTTQQQQLHMAIQRVTELEKENSALRLAQSETRERNAVIEEVAKSIERDLKFLIVAAIRDMKKGD